MELPAKVGVYNQLLGLSNNPGTLVGIRPEGYFELHIANKGRIHVVLLPIAETALVFAEPEPEVEPVAGIER